MEKLGTSATIICLHSICLVARLWWQLTGMGLVGVPTQAIPVRREHPVVEFVPAAILEWKHPVGQPESHTCVFYCCFSGLSVDSNCS